MARDTHRKALSNYRQVRLTFTEERGGWVTVRIMSKPVDAQWNMAHTIISERFRHDQPLTSLGAVFRLIVSYCSQEPLPPPRD